MRLRSRVETRIALAVGLAALVPAASVTAVSAVVLSRAHARASEEEVARLSERVTADRAALDSGQALRRRHAEVLALSLALARDPAPHAGSPASAPALHVTLSSALHAVPELSGAQVVTREGTITATADRPLAVRAPCPPFVVTLPLPAPREGLRLVATYAQDCALHGDLARARGALAARGAREGRARRGYLTVLGLELAVLVVAVGAAVALAVWVSRQVTRRLELLAIASGRVGQGDLSVRVRPRGDDEVDELIRAFNLMVEEMALSRSRIEYLQRIAAWQEFARRLAHEIKNPLTPIQLAVQEVAKKYHGDDARFRRTLETAREVVEEEVDTLRRLVSAFSDFAKLPEAHTQPGDLAEFVRDMATSQAFLEEAAGAEERAVRVVYEPGEKSIPVALDRMLLRRALENLVRNAAQALAPDQGRAREGATVWVRAEARDDQAWLVVEDNGPGIPPERAARVFDPYFTTKAEGTGLGLAIVRKIALDHAGDVGFEPREGGGARFVVTLPLRDPARRPRLSFVTFSGRAAAPTPAPERAPSTPPR